MSAQAASASSRAEYVARINRVVDHIEGHLAEVLSLEDLAEVACFSPFHFHRVFAALTGETLYQFILRLRLERSATQLVQLKDKSITAVALDCGFGGSAAFARAFRAAYGMSASEWRAGGSKNCKPIRKQRKAAPDDPVYLASTAAADRDGASNWRHSMQQTIKEPKSIGVEQMPALTVAYVRHVGPYAGDAGLFGRLFAQISKWAGARGLMNAQTRMLSIYHDNPDITAEEKLRVSVCVTVPPGTRAEGEVGVMEIPAGQCAVARFELGVTEFAGAWNWLYGKWMPESGFQPDDRPCYERCLNDPQAHPQKLFEVEIVAPVRPL
ncbi:MAG: AraC family transcriptional regulator [Deltaproteobacteria bacterium]|nr:AraC family transcriptional regulator [Deltaproteobacteria bacterium]